MITRYMLKLIVILSYQVENDNCTEDFVQNSDVHTDFEQDPLFSTLSKEVLSFCRDQGIKKGISPKLSF